jgi:hypothetical protein
MESRKVRECQAEIRAEIAELEERLQVLREADHALAKLPGGKIPDKGNTSDEASDDVKAMLPAVQDAESETPVRDTPAREPSRSDLVKDILREEGGPVSTVAIVDQLIQMNNIRQEDRRGGWKIVDALLRRGRDRGWCRKVSGGTWEYTENAPAMKGKKS